MNKKSICGFALLVLMVLPVNLLAIAINGFTFDEDSSTLTNPWFSMVVGQSFSMKCTASGQIFTITPTGPETIYGVKCIKWTGGSHDWWLAQDTFGNIHVFKHNSDEVNSNDDIPNYFLPANPVIVGTWNWRMDNFGPVYYEVLSNSAEVGDQSIATYTNCLKVSEGMTGDHWQNMYLKNGIGFVAHEEPEELCIRPLSSSSIYGVWVITDQWKLVDGNITKRIMTEIEVNEQGNSISGAEISNSGKVSFINGPLDDWGYWNEYRSFGKSWNPNTSGLGLSQWMNETYDFVFHANDGDKHSFLTTTDEFAWLPFLDLKLIQGGKNPTFKWNKVAGADQYWVRIVNPAGYGVLIDDIINADGSASYSYNYSGDLFSQYDKLTFRIEARDYDSATGKQLVNRSVVFYEYSASKAIPWLPLLLLDD